MNPIRELDAHALKGFPLPKTEKETDKDERGRVLLIGGSALSPGAVLLSGVAALRAGAGKVLVAAAGSIAQSIGLMAPEFGVAGLRATGTGEPDCADDSLASHLDQCDVVLLGPGMMDRANARCIALKVMERLHVPLVLDAAGITGLSDDFAALRDIKTPLIMTPHAGEMAKLLGISKERVQASPIDVACQAAREFGAIVVLKGATTYIAARDGTLWRHAGGVCGLATAGSGDTLAGLLAALLARGMAPMPACLWSVVVHARSGTKLSHSVGPVGFLARELPETFPATLQALSEQ